ncbi:hypothetical protein EIP86_009485 [Pleurotus ostreatoroseus]|nr:hypothetical protein EIP86_009485 [Pleurotus ostreatoroseus]
MPFALLLAPVSKSPTCRMRRAFWCSCIVIPALTLYTYITKAALYTDSSQLPSLEYDFVVIGATDTSRSDEGILDVHVPFLAYLDLPNSSVTWNYTTTPQAALNNRVLPYSRGRVLGGCSSINLMTYTRASNDDYDRWAKITGDRSWAWENLAPYYFKVSFFTFSARIAIIPLSF